MAKAPWARLTNPIRPMVIESPTETMNSTVPADSPPNRMPARSMFSITCNPRAPSLAKTRIANSELASILFAISRSRYSPIASNNEAAAHGVDRRPGRQKSRRRASITLLGSARADGELLALVLHLIDLSDHLLMQLAVGTLHDLVEIFVHDDVAGRRIDHDRTLGTVELPAFQRLHGLGAVHLALGGLDRVNDGGHAVIAADRHEI